MQDRHIYSRHGRQHLSHSSFRTERNGLKKILSQTSALSRVRSDDGKKLLPGTLVDIGGGGGDQLQSEFFPGQLLGGGDDDDDNVNGSESFGELKVICFFGFPEF